MTKKLIYLFSFLMISVLFVSCNKGCDFPADANTGDIIAGAVVLGGNTSGIPGVFHNESSTYNFKVSFDQGYTYIAVDWTKYAIMNFPISAGCNTHYERNVTITPSAQNVKYKMTIESCPDCEAEYPTDNWVLVKTFPTSYSVTYEKKVK